MPVDDLGALKTGDDAVALSPATCKEAASDIMYTNIINTIWHVVLLASVFLGFLYKRKVPAEYKEAIQLPLFALFLNAGLVNIVNVSTVWKCQFVKDWLPWYLTTSVFCCLFGLIFYFGVFIWPYLKSCFNMCRNRVDTEGYEQGQTEQPLVDAKVGIVNQPGIVNQSGQNYMFRIA